MKILYVNMFYFPNEAGGTEVSIRLLAEGLYKRNHSVSVCVPQFIGGIQLLEEEFENNIVSGIPVYKLPSTNPLLCGKENTKIKKNINSVYIRFRMFSANKERTFLKNFLKLLHLIKPDIVHFNNIPGFPLKEMYKIAKQNSAKIVQTIRDPFLMGTTTLGIEIPIWGYFIRKVITEEADFIHFTTNLMCKEFFRLPGSKLNNKGFVIPNTVGIDFEEESWTKMVLQKCVSLNERIIISFVGSLETTKGIDRLVLWYLENINKFKKTVFLNIIGQGTLENYIKKVLKSQMEKGLVHLTGKLSHWDTLEELKKSHIVILPSIWIETFGRVLVEGFYNGALPVGRRKGGIPEVISDEELLFDSEDELNNIINKISNPQYYLQKMNSLQEHMKKFSYSYHIDQFEKFYNKILLS